MKHLLKAELAALKACISTWKETKVFLHVHAIFNRQCSSSVKKSPESVSLVDLQRISLTKLIAKNQTVYHGMLLPNL